MPTSTIDRVKAAELAALEQQSKAESEAVKIGEVDLRQPGDDFRVGLPLFPLFGFDVFDTALDVPQLSQHRAGLPAFAVAVFIHVVLKDSIRNQDTGDRAQQSDQQKGAKVLTKSLRVL